MEDLPPIDDEPYVECMEDLPPIDDEPYVELNIMHLLMDNEPYVEFIEELPPDEPDIDLFDEYDNL